MSAARVSAVERATDTVTRDYDAAAIIEAIRTGGKKLRGQVGQIRQVAREQGKKAASELKRQLPAVLWNGTFTERASDKLVSHSGLLCADLDSLNGELPKVRGNLLKSPHVWALFVSPSGDGLKAVFRVPADAATHSASYRAVEQHVRELTGIQIDQSGKDVARLCFLSYDSDIYHNASATEIVPLPEPEKLARTMITANVDLPLRERIATELLGPVEWWPEKGAFLCKCPGEHLHTNSTREKHCMVYLNGSPTVKCQHSSCSGSVEVYTAQLRSRIGKAEYAEPRSHIEQQNDSTGLIGAGNGLVEPVLAPTPYVSPPLALLPPSLQDYIHAAAESLNVDVAYVLLPVLSSLGSAIGNTRSILLKRNFIQPPVIWTGIIGRTGSRKTPAIDAGCFPAIERERELKRQNKEAAKIHAEELAQWDGKSRKDRGPRPEPPISLTALMDDLTLATLADKIESNPHGVLVKKDELSHWFASFDQFHNAKGADVSRWLSLHSAVFFAMDRRTDERSYRIYQPRVCIAGGIQPKVLARLLTQDYFERGLPARFLFAAPPVTPDRWSEAEVSGRIHQEALALFNALYDLQPDSDQNDMLQPRLLHLDTDAKAEYVAYYNECGATAAESDEHGEATWSKLSGYASRLALVGQLARNPEAETVEGAVMRAACDLARWFGREAARIYAELAETPEQTERRRLVEFIQKREGSVSARHLARNCHAFHNQTGKAERALAGLVRAGLGDWIEISPKGPGRPTRVFQLLPAPTTTKFRAMLGKTPNCVGVGAPDNLKNAPVAEQPLQTLQPLQAATEPLEAEVGRL